MEIINKKAKFNYSLFERFEAGISLTGQEVKSLKTGRGDLSNSYAKIIGSEAFLINVNLPSSLVQGYDPVRTRKLLLHKSQIISLESKMKQKGLTLVPVKMYTKGRLVKVQLALAKAKRKFEKKELIKRKDLEREIEKEFKNSV